MGIYTNQAFHLRILADTGFLAGKATTNYLEQAILPRLQAEITAKKTQSA